MDTSPKKQKQGIIIGKNALKKRKALLKKD
jgi:hypothetical protein